MPNYNGRIGYMLDGFNAPPPASENLITGEGRMKVRGPDKVESNNKKKRKTARAMAKRSRRQQRR